MSEAENLLNTLGDISIATADPSTEEHIVIDSNRNVYVPESLRRIAVQHDHNIETVTFDCPRYWDGNDLSEMKFYVNYRRSDGYVDRYLVENVTLDEEYRVVKITDSPASNVYTVEISDEIYTPLSSDISYGTTVDGYPIYMHQETGSNIYYVKIGSPDILHFDWVISRNATAVKGGLAFLVCANTTDENGDETLHWNSELNQQMTVSEGLEVTDTVEEMYPDIITSMLLRMDRVETDNANTRAYIDDGLNREVNDVVESKIVNGNITGVDLTDYPTIAEMEGYVDQETMEMHNIAQEMSDYIIESGSVVVAITNHAYVTSDNITWYYTKYKNGDYKCRGMIDLEIASTSKMVYDHVPYPIEFIENPIVTVFGQSSSTTHVWIGAMSTLKQLHCFQYHPFESWDGAKDDKVSIEVTGRWK